MKKKFLSVMMTVVLLVSSLSGTALAIDGEVITEAVQAVEEVASEPEVEEPAAEEPAEVKVEEPVAEEPVVEEKVEEAEVEESAAEEPVVEDAEAEEPAAEEKAEAEEIEEPAVEEPAAEEKVEEAKAIEVTASVEKVAPVTNSAVAEEKVCEEGCILTGEEHDECFVWVDCTLTEGCEGPEGHEGECYGSALYAEDGGTITISNAKSAYVVVGTEDGSRNDTLYKTDRNGVICDLNGNSVTFEEGNYYIWYGTAGATANRSFYADSVTVNSDSESVRLESARNSVASTASAITEDQWNWATCVYYNTSTCDHIHIRVAGSYTIDISGATYSATVSNPSIAVYVNDKLNTTKSWSGTTNYEWTYKTNISLSNEIEVHLKMDLTYRDASGSHTLKDVEIVYNNVSDRNRWIEFIAICDGIQGFDFTVSVQDIQEVIDYYNVIYQWRVYNLDGSVSNDLPVSLGAHGLPSPASGIEAGTEYVYNTGYVEGTSYYDYENGLLYTFHGWDTYSHSSVFNVDATAAGYEKLDDGDTDASNNKKIPITADTWINGYWTVSVLEPAEAYLMVKKNVVVENGDANYVKNYLQNISKLFISIDPGIDKDGDDASQVDVDYLAATSSNGYRIDVYQYETPFVFNEYQAEVPGYTRSTVISTTGDNLSLVSEDGTSVSGTTAAVEIEEEYNPAQSPYNLGTVTYTNIYTKNTGTAVSEYPTLTILKSAADTGDFQSDVEFTLYRDVECKNAVDVYTTDSDGFVSVDFEGFSAGTYYLKETKANAGYVEDAYTYPITLTAGEPVEEMHWNNTTNKYEYVEVIYYTLSVNMPEDSTAVYVADEHYQRLHFYNSPIMGNLTVKKAVAGINDSTDLLSKLDAVVIVHGPIVRDGQGVITDIGNTWRLNLNEDNEVKFQDSLYELPYGEYLIHESFASVHGYTWNNVAYSVKEGTLGDATYNNIASKVFSISENEQDIEITITNNYSEWAAADFYIKKVDGSDNALAGAEFTLYTKEECSTPAASGQGYTVTATTKADGYAYFSGFTAPEEETTTFYLKETKAPAGYYLSDTVYKVEISPETDTVARTTTYEAKIYVKNDSDEWVLANFNSDTDLLTVVNSPVLGKLSITKTLIDAPADVKPITVLINGPDNYSKEVELNRSNDWSATLENLALGSYTVVEKNVHQPGYTVVAEYQVGDNKSSASAEVELKEGESGKTEAGTIISGSVSITNTYTQNNEYYEVPAKLTVKKVAEDGKTPLAGAVFKLERMDIHGEEVINSISFTTNEEGYVIFDLLSGFITNNEPVAGNYTLTEVKAPDGYEATDEKWFVNVMEEDGKLRVELDADKNVFENFWDWIVGSIEGYSSRWTFADGILTVPNARKVGSLTIVKNVVDEEGYYKDAEYSFTLDCSDDAFDQTFTLKANESYTVENIPWGTTYTLTEDTKDAAFVSVITDESDGVIAEYETRIVVTNTYTYYDFMEYTDDTGSAVLNLLKVDADDNKKVISGAGFTLYADSELTDPLGEEVFSDEYGKVVIPIGAPGTYYLAETTSPEGYQENDAVYVVTATEEYVIRNAGTSDAFTEILLSITVEGLSEIGENSYIVENEAEKEDGDSKDNDKDTTDNNKKTPKTGDGNNLTGLAVRFMISLIGLCTVLILWFQMRKREDER